MFFTIIIPAYNCESTINRLLDSIKDQEMNDLKVIVTDDSRGDGHTDLYEYIKPYEQYFPIDYYRRESEPYTIHCPGNTRHSGLNRALKEDTTYILFIDNDDQFIPGKFQVLKDMLVQANCPDVVGSRFDVHNTDGSFAYKEHNSLGWLHGKMYKKDFIVKHNIQFKVDMEAHEDTYFNCLVTYHEMVDHISPSHFDNLSFYIWYKQPTSVSHNGFDAKNEIFIQKHFRDYCYSCIGVFLENYKKGENTEHEVKRQFALRIAHSIYMAYCYFQGFVNRGQRDRLKTCYEVLKENLWDYYKTFDVTKEDLINIVYADPEIFINHRNISYIGVGHFIERESFQDFVRNMRFFE